MDIQKQIAFEKFHAKECNCDYNELKRRLDHQEKVMGHRYIPSSPRHEAWLVWDAAWQAKAQAVQEGFVLVPKEMPKSFDEGLYVYSNSISIVDECSEGFIPMSDINHAEVWKLVIEAQEQNQ